MRGWASAKKLVGRFAAGDRRRRRIVLILSFAFVATLAAVFVSRQISIADMRRDVARLRADQAAAAARQKELRTEVSSTTNRATLEAEARERLGLVLPGEEKAYFVEERVP